MFSLIFDIFSFLLSVDRFSYWTIYRITFLVEEVKLQNGKSAQQLNDQPETTTWFENIDLVFQQH